MMSAAANTHIVHANGSDFAMNDDAVYVIVPMVNEIARD